MAKYATCSQLPVIPNPKYSIKGERETIKVFVAVYACINLQGYRMRTTIYVKRSEFTFSLIRLVQVG